MGHQGLSITTLYYNERRFLSPFNLAGSRTVDMCLCLFLLLLLLLLPLLLSSADLLSMFRQDSQARKFAICEQIIRRSLLHVLVCNFQEHRFQCASVNSREEVSHCW